MTSPITCLTFLSWISPEISLLSVWLGHGSGSEPRSLGLDVPRRDVEDVVMRQSVLLDPKRFTTVFDKLESVGSVLHGMGAPGGSVRHVGSKKRYRYDAFHQFEFPFTSVVGAPLVFLHHDTSGAELFINPDLSLFFELEERSR